ncbi:MAG TPA: GlsB/YeaQ/YmgE family stress response membrane protein [Methylophilus sp.]
MSLVWFILIGICAGWLAGQIMKGGGYGLVGDLIVGVIGALLGGFLFSSAGVSAGGGIIGSLIVATIGAIVLIFILRLIKR